MNWLKKRKVRRLQAAVAPMLEEAPRHTGAELERMVAEVYDEKLDLERQLEAAWAQIERMENTVVKIDAAETFARQQKNANDDLRGKLKKAEENLEWWRERAGSEEARAKTVAVEVDKLKRQLADAAEAARPRIVGEMIAALEEEGGGWSKARVRDFLASFGGQL